jgi:hypothetical protein
MSLLALAKIFVNRVSADTELMRQGGFAFASSHPEFHFFGLLWSQ